MKYELAIQPAILEYTDCTCFFKVHIITNSLFIKTVTWVILN